MGSITAYPAAASQAPNTPVTLAYAQITADTATVTASADVPGLSVTVTVPEGRRLRVSVHGLMWGDTDGAGARLAINEGAVMLQLVDTGMTGAKQEGLDASVILTPSAGTHTYKAVYSRWTGTGNVKVLANAAYPAYILVEDITGLPAPVSAVSVPVGVLAQQYTTTNVTYNTGDFITALALNVVVPAGRLLRISANSQMGSMTVGSAWFVNVFEDGVDVGRIWLRENVQGTRDFLDGFLLRSPTAGAHAYTFQVTKYSGTGTILFEASGKASSCVEDITPTPAPSSGAPGSTLGYAEATGNQGSITSTQTDITGLSVTVTVPAGRRIRISARTYWTSTTSDGDALTGIFEGATQLQESRGYVGGTTAPFAAEPSVVLSPSAGTHTYKVVGKRVTGTGTLTNNVFSGGTSFILVEDITGSVWPTGSAVTAGMVASEAWQDISPTFTQGVALTYTKNYCRYQRIGRTINMQFDITFTSTGTAGNAVLMTLPIPLAVGGYRQIGLADYYISGAKYFCAIGSSASTTVMRFLYLHLTTDAILGANAPFSGSVVASTLLTGFLSYEAAS